MARPEPRQPTLEDRAGYAAALERLDRGPRRPLHAMQSTLATIERLWRPIQPAYQILDVVSPKRGIAPTEADVLLVARLSEDPSPVVRQHVVRALKHATTHRALVVPVLRKALVDDDCLLRMAAAVATFELALGSELQDELLRALESPTWRVRWYAAAALASTSHRERAGEVLAASYPEKPNRSSERAIRYAYEWQRLANAFSPPPPAVCAKLEWLQRRGRE